MDWHNVIMIFCILGSATTIILIGYELYKFKIKLEQNRLEAKIAFIKIQNALELNLLDKKFQHEQAILKLKQELELDTLKKKNRIHDHVIFGLEEQYPVE